MDWVLLAGRILFAATFVQAGVMLHLGRRRMATEYARSQGVPLADLGVPLTGVLIAVGGTLIALGLWVDLAALVVAANVLAFAYWMHAFWKLDDPQMRANQQAHFMKNVAMVGGALALFYLFNQFGPAIGLTIGDGRLFGPL
jgi:uncharacterized membrane protein YphA (DoxX/SURF4 family)